MTMNGHGGFNMGLGEIIFGLIVVTIPLSLILFWIFYAGGGPSKSSLEMQLHQQHLEEETYHEAMMQSMRDNLYRDDIAAHNTTQAMGDALKSIGTMLGDLSR